MYSWFHDSNPIPGLNFSGSYLFVRFKQIVQSPNSFGFENITIGDHVNGVQKLFESLLLFGQNRWCHDYGICGLTGRISFRYGIIVGDGQRRWLRDVGGRLLDKGAGSGSFDSAHDGLYFKSLVQLLENLVVLSTFDLQKTSKLISTGQTTTSSSIDQ